MTERILTPPQLQSQENRIAFEQYLSEFDGQYAEWVMGGVEVYMSNNVLHQAILLFLAKLLDTYLGFTGVGQVLLAGVAMYISDEQPARQPDLMIILKENLDRIEPTFVNGVADIVVEIVSPESTERDYGDKFVEYETAGIPEYWRIDPIRQQVDIYRLGEDSHYHRMADGNLESPLLPKFSLDPAILWQDELPQGMAFLSLVGGMLDMEFKI